MKHNYRFLQAILAQKTPTIEASMENIFVSTVFEEDGHILEIFLESGIDPNIAIPGRAKPGVIISYTITALEYFAQRNNVALARKMIYRSASFNDGFALREAARYGSIGVVKLLIEKGVNVNEQGIRRTYSALQAAAANGNLEIARTLLDNRADINATSDHCCALSLAAKAGAMDVVDMLLDYQADIDCRPSGEGDNPIQAAARADNHELVKRLLRMGAEAKSPAIGWDG